MITRTEAPRAMRGHAAVTGPLVAARTVSGTSATLFESSGERVGGEFHVTEVLKKLFEHVEHDRRVGCVAV